MLSGMARSGILGMLGSVLERGASALRRSPSPARPGADRRADRGGPRQGGADEIVVSYAPRNDGHPDPGEVVWGWIPFEDDPSQGKDRPSIAIGWWRGQLVLVPFTSKDQHGRPGTYEIGSGGWDSSGRSSWVKLDRMIPVDPASVRREGSALDQARFRALIHKLHELHGAQLRPTS
jgi:hypothetical protein